MGEENHNLCCVFFPNSAKNPLYLQSIYTLSYFTIFQLLDYFANNYILLFTILLVTIMPGRHEPVLMRYNFSGKYPGA